MGKTESYIISLPKHLDDRGNLSFFESNNHIPFDIKRVHWIYDVPGGEMRGGLAYKTTDEFIVAMSGSFDVVVDDGNAKQRFNLNRSYMGLYVPRGVWRSIENFSTNSVAVIAASTHYDLNDAVRDYDEFVNNFAEHKNQIIFPINNNQQHQSANYSSRMKNNVYDCSIIELDRHHSIRKGDISVVENGETLPFDVRRVYYLYDVPGGIERGGHAHKELHQLIIAASGSFSVTLDDGNVKRTFVLNRPYQGLYIKPGIWRTLSDFSSGSVCLVLASEKYDENDYIRTYNEFKKYREL